MYKWETEANLPRRRRTPSFSSSLLDAIYRSIDDSRADDEDQDLEEEQPRGCYTRDRAMNMKKKKMHKEEKGRNNLRRAMMIESWVEKQSVESSTLSNSASSSSAESSSGALWSSSETESTQKQRSKTKPFRATIGSVSSSHSEKKMMAANQFDQKKTTKSENGGFSKTKLKALKIYGELKKVKQPISPGGRIASFINSIFNSGNVKKAKMCYVGAVEDVTSENISKSAPCSSSASRSCLSKTTPSRAKHTVNGAKRSVRFYPVNVILGEESQEDPSLMPLSAIRGFVRSSSLKEAEEPRKEKCLERETRGLLRDHLVGIGRYREELPVYETTSLKTNQAIANGLIL
ncbi:AF-like protein [Parasponia andersonii]|uniref:AF-like protein n=1 Tax=Parasponia andersonii TaxID=3476 RepID=A0A2P5C1G4_PARAD|nr:AF-like protein [Parasponia andersonii]